MQVNIVGRPADAVMGVCSSAYMKQLSNSTRNTAALLFKISIPVIFTAFWFFSACFSASN